MTTLIEDLGRLPAGAIITVPALAAMFHRCEATVRRAWKCGELSKPVQLFGALSWTAESILAHLRVRLERAEREAERDREKVRSVA